LRKTLMVELSNTGRRSDSRDGLVNLYALTSGELVRQVGWAEDYGWFGFVRGGSRWASLRCTSTECVGVVESPDGATVDSTWTIPVTIKPEWAAVSPSGRRTSIGGYIYEGTTLIVPEGAAGLWLNEERLVTFYHDIMNPGVRASAATRIDTAGTQLSRVGISALNYFIKVNGIPALDVLQGGSRLFIHRGAPPAVMDVAISTEAWRLPGDNIKGNAAATDTHILFSRGFDVRVVLDADSSELWVWAGASARTAAPRRSRSIVDLPPSVIS
jgi:hypothetical protein